MTAVMTVTGPVDPAELGPIHSHEHVLWDYFNMIASYDCVLDDAAIATDELRRLAAVGTGTVVDASTVGIRTNVGLLPRIATESGVNIVLGTGWYRERLYPRVVHELASAHLAEILIGEITEGIADTGVRAGIIGEIGTERGCITPAEERVFRAAARAHHETGVAILTHTTHFGELALDQIDLLADAGVAPDRIVISHLGDRSDPELLLCIAARGVYMSIDNIGYTEAGYPGDDVRADNVVRLVRGGHGDRVVLGTDISTKSALTAFGGSGYTRLHDSFLPMLRDRGLDDDELRALTTDNMAAALTPRAS